MVTLEQGPAGLLFNLVETLLTCNPLVILPLSSVLIIVADRKPGPSQNRKSTPLSNGGERKMDRKIIIRVSDFNKEIYSFLLGIGQIIPLIGILRP